MVLDMILIGALVIFVILFLKYKSQVETLKKQLSVIENRAPQKHQEEFSLELKKLNSEFIDPILLDPLTGLPGRKAFEDRLLQTLNQSKRFEKSFAVILLDIHKFNLVNKEKNYETGDKLLREVAKRLQGTIRQIDTITRFAGDVFIFLLPQLSLPETAVYVAQRLLDNIVQPFEIDGQSLSVTANVGVAIYPSDGNDIKTLLKNADDALCQAKIKGPGKYQFYRQEMHALGQRELSIRSFLCGSDAVQKLSIYYYPYMNVAMSEVVCVQAVPFLSLADFGLIGFTEFAKIAENCGKIAEIGEWLIKNAIVQFKKWHVEGFTPAQLAVKVTLRQIGDSHFLYNISKILQELQISPKQLIFEVMEENILANTEALEESFAMLNAQGIEIAISIFTLGRFALQKITKLPVNYLKIDAKLIQEEKSHQENETILHMLVALAKDMNISIVAEGVNSERQKKFLQTLGCEVMQGKLFGESLLAGGVPTA